MQNLHGASTKRGDTDDAPTQSFIPYVPGSKKRYVINALRHREVRVQAAKSSAAARKATIAQRAAQKPNVPSKDSPLKPDAKADASLVLNAGRAQLWHQILNDQILYQATLLAVLAGRSVDTVNAFFRTDLSYVRFGAIWARGQALEQVRTCVSNGQSRQATAAIALLASLDVKFGDLKSYHLHMQAWRTLCSSSGVCDTGIEEAHVLTLSDAVFDAVSQAVKKSSPPPARGALVAKRHAESEESELQPGFMVFTSARQDVHKLLKMATQLGRAQIDPEALRYFHMGSIGWQPSKAHAIYSPVEAVAIHSIWCLLPTLAAKLALVPPYADRQVFDMDTAAGIQIIEYNFRSMQLESLQGTQFENVLLWLVFTMCAISGRVHQRCFRILRSIMISHPISTWDQLESILRQHVYRKELYEDCLSLFEALRDRFEIDSGYQVWLSESMLVRDRALVIEDV